MFNKLRGINFVIIINCSKIMYVLMITNQMENIKLRKHKIVYER